MKERDIRIDYIRAVAVSFMILQHVVIFLNSPDVSITYMSAVIMETILLITKCAVPLFVMITGAVFLSDSVDKQYSMRKALKLAKKMILVIAFWNVIAAVFTAILGDGLKEMASSLIFGKWWYLYMLVGLYIYMAIADLILKSVDAAKFTIMLFILYELYISLFLLLPGNIQSPANRLVNKFFPQFFMTNIGTVMIGCYVSRGKKIVNNRLIRMGIIILSVISTVVLLAVSINRAVLGKAFNYIYFDEFTSMIIAAFILKFGMKKIKNVKPEGICRKIIYDVGTHSLGIYVTSNLLLEILERFKIYTENIVNIYVGTFILWGGYIYRGTYYYKVA